MTKKILFAGLLISMITAPAATQLKAEKSGEINASGGNSGVFMDKHSPEQREPCAKQATSGNDQKNPKGDSFFEGWPTKWVKGEKPPEASSNCRTVDAEGGGNGI